MRALAITETYNEAVNLPIWLQYYGRNFGKENLLILDNESDDGSTNNLAAYNHVRIPRSEFNENRRARLISELQQSLCSYYDAILYCDSDEIIVPDPDRYSSLRDYVTRFISSDAIAVRTLGLNLVHITENEPEFVAGKPVLGQRKFVWFKSIYCKPLLVKSPVIWDVGFHNCNLKANVDPSLYLFHLRDMDKTTALNKLQRTRGLNWAQSHIDTGIGIQQRLDDQTYIDHFFIRHATSLRNKGPMPFDFHEEARKINQVGLTDFDSGGVSLIPERFMGIF